MRCYIDRSIRGTELSFECGVTQAAGLLTVITAPQTLVTLFLGDTQNWNFILLTYWLQ